MAGEPGLKILETVDEASLNTMSGSLVQHSGSGWSSYPPAGHGRRFVAALIDGIFGSVIFKLFWFGLLALHAQPKVAIWFADGFMYILYFVGPTYVSGQTLGKKLMGLKVVTKDFSDEPGFLQIFFRESLGKLISVAFLFLGYLWILFNGEHRGWHDYLFGTREIEVGGAN